MTVAGPQLSKSGPQAAFGSEFPVDVLRSCRNTLGDPAADLQWIAATTARAAVSHAANMPESDLGPCFGKAVDNVER
jgi:hypothetical protein